MAATKTAKAKNRATAMHSQIVRSRGQCQTPGCYATTNLQCAHIVSRRYSATRTDVENALCLCAGCHMHYTEWPLEFAAFVVSVIGDDAYQALKLKAQLREKVNWAAEVERLKPLWDAVNR